MAAFDPPHNDRTPGKLLQSTGVGGAAVGHAEICRPQPAVGGGRAAEPTGTHSDLHQPGPVLGVQRTFGSFSSTAEHRPVAGVAEDRSRSIRTKLVMRPDRRLRRIGQARLPANCYVELDGARVQSVTVREIGAGGVSSATRDGQDRNAVVASAACEGQRNTIRAGSAVLEPARSTPIKS